MALQFAELLITSPESITDAFFEELGLHFSQVQIVEMLYYVLYFQIPHRYGAALQITPPQGHTLAVKPNPFLAREAQVTGPAR